MITSEVYDYWVHIESETFNASENITLGPISLFLVVNIYHLPNKFDLEKEK